MAINYTKNGILWGDNNSQYSLTYDQIMNGLLKYADPAKDIADHAVSLLFGQGFNVAVLENDKIDEKLTEEWNKIAQRNKFEEILKRNEWDISYYGFTFNTIDKANDGKVWIGQTDPFYLNRIATFQQIKGIGAVVYKKMVVNEVSWVMREFWTTKSVERQWFTEKGDQKTIIEAESVEIPKEFNLPEKENHNLGILPVKLITNKNRNVSNNRQFYEQRDTETAQIAIKSLNLFSQQQLIEALFNTTKVFGNFPINKIKQMLGETNGNQKVIDFVMSNLYIDAKQRGENSESRIVDILQANPAFEKYILAKNDALRQIWRAAGYTYLSGEESTSSNADALNANAWDMRTTKIKKSNRQLIYAELIKDCLLAEGIIQKEQYENIKVIFNIHENIVQSPNQIADKMIKLLDAGLITKARALMKIENLATLEEAEQIVKEAQKEQQEAAKNEMEQLAQISNNNNFEENSQDTANLEPNGENK